MSRKIKIILLLGFLITITNICNSQNWNDSENLFLNYLGTNMIPEAKILSKKLVTDAEKHYGDTSIQYSKSIYYGGLIDLVEGDYMPAISHFSVAKKYYAKESQKKCGFYHQILDKLAFCLFYNYDYENAYKISFELIELENKCRELGNYEYKLAVDIYAQTCLNIPFEEEKGVKLIFNSIGINNNVIEKIKNDKQYENLKFQLIGENINYISLIQNYYELNNNLGNALLTNDLLNQYFSLNLPDKLKYKLLEPYKRFQDDETKKKLIDNQIYLIKNKNIFADYSVDYYYNLAFLNRQINNFSESAINYENAIAALKKEPKSEIYQSGKLLHYLADAYMGMENYKIALEAINKEVDVLKREKKFNKENQINTDIFLAQCNFRSKNYKDAEIIADRLIAELSEKAEASNYILSVNIKLMALEKLNKWEQCIPFINISYKNYLSALIQIFSIGSNRERKNESAIYILKLEDNYEVICKTHTSNPATKELAYNISLLTKGILHESDIKVQNLIKSLGDSSLTTPYNYLRSIKSIVAKLSSEGEQNKDYIKKLEHRADSLDQLLSRNISAYTTYKKNFTVTWKDVQSNLGNDEASIEFVRYYDDTDSAYHYMALIVKSGDKYPALVKICSENELKKLSPEKELGEIYSLVWKPISNELIGINTIYYTPAGLMNNIPFQALYEDNTEGREYLLDKYSLNQLTSTRYLALGLKKKSQEPIETNIALFGGVNYNDYPEIINDESNYLMSDASFLYKNSITSRDLADTRSGASYLPGTKKEVENIADLLKSSKWEVTTTEGKNASENKIKAFSGTNSKSILHIATHGFAFPDKVESKREELFGTQTRNEKYKVSDNPMIRCGLLFSGANMTWQGNGDSLLKTTNEDAVLTAYELSQLDLSNTKLVVLSACETGKGAIQGSEGTFGLKRALKLAGVDNIIVSLWKVPDDATMEMMTLFYNELAKTKMPVSSFENAQKSMRLKYPNEPKKWAGFVFVR
jgi:CHAT domain-containing protein